MSRLGNVDVAPVTVEIEPDPDGGLRLRVGGVADVRGDAQALTLVRFNPYIRAAGHDVMPFGERRYNEDDPNRALKGHIEASKPGDVLVMVAHGGALAGLTEVGVGALATLGAERLDMAGPTQWWALVAVVGERVPRAEVLGPHDGSPVTLSSVVDTSPVSVRPMSVSGGRWAIELVAAQRPEDMRLSVAGAELAGPWCGDGANAVVLDPATGRLLSRYSLGQRWSLLQQVIEAVPAGSIVLVVGHFEWVESTTNPYSQRGWIAELGSEQALALSPQDVWAWALRTGDGLLAEARQPRADGPAQLELSVKPWAAPPIDPEPVVAVELDDKDGRVVVNGVELAEGWAPGVLPYAAILDGRTGEVRRSWTSADLQMDPWPPGSGASPGDLFVAIVRHRSGSVNRAFMDWLVAAGVRQPRFQRVYLLRFVGPRGSGYARSIWAEPRRLSVRVPAAAPTRRLRIESGNPNAHVWVGDPAGGPGERPIVRDPRVERARRASVVTAVALDPFDGRCLDTFDDGRTLRHGPPMTLAAFVGLQPAGALIVLMLPRGANLSGEEREVCLGLGAGALLDAMSRAAVCLVATRGGRVVASAVGWNGVFVDLPLALDLERLTLRGVPPLSKDVERVTLGGVDRPALTIEPFYVDRYTGRVLTIPREGDQVLASVGGFDGRGAIQIVGPPGPDGAGAGPRWGPVGEWPPSRGALGNPTSAYALRVPLRSAPHPRRVARALSFRQPGDRASLGVLSLAMLSAQVRADAIDGERALVTGVDRAGQRPPLFIGLRDGALVAGPTGEPAARWPLPEGWAGRWHEITVACYAGGWRIYVDRRLVAHGSSSQTVYGAYTLGAWADGTASWQGAIGTCRIWQDSADDDRAGRLRRVYWHDNHRQYQSFELNGPRNRNVLRPLGPAWVDAPPVNPPGVVFAAAGGPARAIAVELDGGPEDLARIEPTFTALVDPQAEITIEAWVRLDRVDGRHTIIAQDVDDGGFMFGAKYGTWYAGWWNDERNPRGAGAPIAESDIGRPLHVAAIWRAARRGEWSIYVDGRQVGRDHASPGIGAIGGADWVIGGRRGRQQGLVGALSGLRVWSRALAEDELRAAMFRWVDSAPSLVAEWRCARRLPKLADLHRGLTIDTEHLPRGRGPLSDGRRLLMQLDDEAHLDLGQTPVPLVRRLPSTIDLWVRPDRIDGGMAILTLGPSERFDKGAPSLWLTATGGRCRLEYLDGRGWQHITAPEVDHHLAAARWTHLAVRLGPDRVSLFVDGREVGHALPLDGAIRLADGSRLLLGVGAGMSPWRGRMVDLRCWSEPMTDAQMRRLPYLGSTRGAEPLPSIGWGWQIEPAPEPAAWWPLDAGPCPAVDDVHRPPPIEVRGTAVDRHGLQPGVVVGEGRWHHWATPVERHDREIWNDTPSAGTPQANSGAVVPVGALLGEDVAAGAIVDPSDATGHVLADHVDLKRRLWDWTRTTTAEGSRIRTDWRGVMSVYGSDDAEVRLTQWRPAGGGDEEATVLRVALPGPNPIVTAMPDLEDEAAGIILDDAVAYIAWPAVNAPQPAQAGPDQWPTEMPAADGIVYTDDYPIAGGTRHFDGELVGGLTFRGSVAVPDGLRGNLGAVEGTRYLLSDLLKIDRVDLELTVAETEASARVEVEKTWSIGVDGLSVDVRDPRIGFWITRRSATSMRAKMQGTRPKLKLTKSAVAFKAALDVHLGEALGGTTLTADGDITIAVGNSSGVDGGFRLVKPLPWEEPLGFPGLRIDALMINLDLETLLPTMFHGDLTLGEVGADVVFKFKLGGNKATRAIKTMLAARLRQDLSAGRLLSSLLPGVNLGPLDDALSVVTLKAPKQGEWNVYAVPQTMTVDDVQYAAGLAINGDVEIFGLHLGAHLRLDEQRLALSGTIDPIELGGVLKISGPRGRPPSFEIAAAGANITGGIELLGQRFDARLDLGLDGTSIHLGARLSLFEVDLTLATDGPDFGRWTLDGRVGVELEHFGFGAALSADVVFGGLSLSALGFGGHLGIELDVLGLPIRVSVPTPPDLKLVDLPKLITGQLGDVTQWIDWVKSVIDGFAVLPGMHPSWSFTDGGMLITIADDAAGQAWSILAKAPGGLSNLVLSGAFTWQMGGHLPGKLLHEPPITITFSLDDVPVTGEMLSGTIGLKLDLLGHEAFDVDFDVPAFENPAHLLDQLMREVGNQCFEVNLWGVHGEWCTAWDGKRLSVTFDADAAGLDVELKLATAVTPVMPIEVSGRFGFDESIDVPVPDIEHLGHLENTTVGVALEVELSQTQIAGVALDGRARVSACIDAILLHEKIGPVTFDIDALESLLDSVRKTAWHAIERSVMSLLSNLKNLGGPLLRFLKDVGKLAEKEVMVAVNALENAGELVLDGAVDAVAAVADVFGISGDAVSELADEIVDEAVGGALAAGASAVKNASKAIKKLFGVKKADEHPEAPDKGVRIYQKREGGGSHVVLPEGRYPDLSQMARKAELTWSNDISSYGIAHGYTVMFFKEVNFGGRVVIHQAADKDHYKDKIPWLNDEVSSIVVIKGRQFGPLPTEQPELAYLRRPVYHYTSDRGDRPGDFNATDQLSLGNEPVLRYPQPQGYVFDTDTGIAGERVPVGTHIRVGRAQRKHNHYAILQISFGEGWDTVDDYWTISSGQPADEVRQATFYSEGGSTDEHTVLSRGYGRVGFPVGHTGTRFGAGRPTVQPLWPDPFSGTVTLEAWIRLPQAGPSPGEQVIIGRRDDDRGMSLGISDDGQYVARAWLAGIGDVPDQRYAVKVPIPVGDHGRWTHLAAVYDGRSWRLYRLGDPSPPVKAPFGLQPSARPWSIGGFFGGDALFDGWVAYARARTTALTRREVREQMLEPLGPLATTPDHHRILVWPPAGWLIESRS